MGCSHEGLRDATATIWGKWQWKAVDWPERATNITEYVTTSLSAEVGWASSAPRDFSSAVEDSCSRPLEMLAKPTSTCLEISGAGGAC